MQKFLRINKNYPSCGKIERGGKETKERKRGGKEGLWEWESGRFPR